MKPPWSLSALILVVRPTVAPPCLNKGKLLLLRSSFLFCLAGTMPYRCRLWSRVLVLGPCDMAETLWLEVPKLKKRCQRERSARPDKCIAGQTRNPKDSTVGKLPGLGKNRTSNHGTWAGNGTSTSGILARKKKEWKSELWYTMEEPWVHGAQLKERIQTAMSCLISFVRSVWKRQIHTKSK